MSGEISAVQSGLSQETDSTMTTFIAMDITESLTAILSPSPLKKSS